MVQLTHDDPDQPTDQRAALRDRISHRKPENTKAIYLKPSLEDQVVLEIAYKCSYPSGG